MIGSPRRPNLVILAGPNGSGKSTVADFLLSKKSIAVFVNADVIARGLGENGTAASDIRSGKIMLAQLHGTIESGQDIAFESTMSGRSWMSLINSARKHNYEITICFVAVSAPEISLSRVKQRVSEGGHHIKNEVLQRRFPRSLRMFLTVYSKLADNWYFFDNSQLSAELVALKENGTPPHIFNGEVFNAYVKHFGS